jgi:hypothetical protein
VTWADAALGLAAFAVTWVEAAIGTRQLRATVRGDAWRAAHWGALFEFVLLLDIWFLIHAYWLAVPVILGAWLGVFYSVRTQKGKTL